MLLFLLQLNSKGDVYLKDEKHQYIEETKNFSSKNFSFADHQVLNTMVYFIDCYLESQKCDDLYFGFYATCETSKENKTKRTNSLNITLPNDKIIDLLINKKMNSINLLDAIIKFTLDEYQLQYEKNKALEKSYFNEIKKWDDNDWIVFLKKINWCFKAENVHQIEKTVFKQIKKSQLYFKYRLKGKEKDILTRFYYELEKKQLEKNILQRFINYDKVENIFLKAKDNSEIINIKPLKVLVLSEFNFNIKDKIKLEKKVDKIIDKLKPKENIGYPRKVGQLSDTFKSV